MEYFKYLNIWDEENFTYVSHTHMPGEYPFEYIGPNPINEDDILLYSAKYSSISLNVSCNWQINKRYLLLLGFQYNKDHEFNATNIIDFNTTNIMIFM